MRNAASAKFDAPVTDQQHRIEPDHVAAATRIGADQAWHRFDGGDRFDTLIAIGGHTRYVSGIEIKAGRFTERLRFAPKRRTRFRQGCVLGKGNSAASARQPQKYNQKPHQVDFGSDYGIYTGCRDAGTGAVP